MNVQESSFFTYKASINGHWQKKILTMCWFMASAILCVEVMIYLMMVKQDIKKINDFAYILIRIVCPTIMDFGAIITATILQKSRKIKDDHKNMFVSFAIFMVCSVLAIFHNYYQVLLCALSFPFYICAIFGDSRLLKKLVIITIPSLIISVLTFWFDKEIGPSFYKCFLIVCDVAFIICSYFFARAIIESQKKQVNYIHNTYQKQTELIEELKIEPLTKLCNRSAMEETIDRIINQQKGSEKKSYLVMLDLDFFKKVNDTYGHLAGDEVLVKLSSIIKNHMGTYRKAFRYGGEEFVLLFEDSKESYVIDTVESIRMVFSKSRFHFAPEKSFTLSGGIAESKREYERADWIDAADQALYFAKSHGRNQIKVWDEKN